MLARRLDSRIWTPPERRLRLYTPEDLRRYRADHFPPVVPFRPRMNAITCVQSNATALATGSTITGTWGSNTTAGNTLIAMLTSENTTNSGAITLPSAAWAEPSPSPWTNATSPGCTLRLFTAFNAASQASGVPGQQSWVWTTGGVPSTLCMAEYSGLGPSPTLDGVSAGTNPTAKATGNSSSPQTNAFTPNALTDLLLGMFAGATGASVVTNLFYTYGGSGNLRQQDSTHTGIGVAARGAGGCLIDALGTGYSGSVVTTLSTNETNVWIAVSIAYKSASLFPGDEDEGIRYSFRDNW